MRVGCVIAALTLACVASVAAEPELVATDKGDFHLIVDDGQDVAIAHRMADGSVTRPRSLLGLIEDVAGLRAAFASLNATVMSISGKVDDVAAGSVVSGVVADLARLNTTVQQLPTMADVVTALKPTADSVSDLETQGGRHEASIAALNESTTTLATDLSDTKDVLNMIPVNISDMLDVVAGDLSTLSTTVAGLPTTDDLAPVKNALGALKLQSNSHKNGLDGLFDMIEAARAPALGTECVPAVSCTEILERSCSGKKPSGLYWLVPVNGGTPYQAWCDMETEGGGFEIVWKNLGGPSLPNAAVSNLRLREGENTVSPLLPPVSDDITSHTSAMSPQFMGQYANYEGDLEWVKVVTSYDSSNAIIGNRVWRVVMPDKFNFGTIFGVTPGTTCYQADARVTVYRDGVFKGSTVYINALFDNYESRTYGLANPSATADQCGGDYINDAVRHLFSYIDTASGADTSRCETSCWAKTDTGYETFYWAVRPQRALGSVFEPAAYCTQVINQGPGTFWLQSAGVKYKAYCEDGFELMLRHTGGPASSASRDGRVSFAQLRRGARIARHKPVLPPTTVPSSQTSLVSPGWAARANTDDAMWMKAIMLNRVNETGFQFEVDRQIITFDFGAESALADVFAAQSSCTTLDSPFEVTIDDQPAGSTDSVFRTDSKLGPAPFVFFSEIHYDNVGDDSGERVEVTGPAGTSLAGWSIIAYNGNNGDQYDEKVFPAGTVIEDTKDGSGVIFTDLAGLQNGEDAICLVDADDNIVDFIIYEVSGTWLPASNGKCAGAMPRDIGLAQSSSTPHGSSLSITGSGADIEDFTWVATNVNSFGEVNPGLSFPADVSFGVPSAADACGTGVVSGDTLIRGDGKPSSTGLPLLFASEEETGDATALSCSVSCWDDPVAQDQLLVEAWWFKPPPPVL